MQNIIISIQNQYEKLLNHLLFFPQNKSLESGVCLHSRPFPGGPATLPEPVPPAAQTRGRQAGAGVAWKAGWDARLYSPEYGEEPVSGISVASTFGAQRNG